MVVVTDTIPSVSSLPISLPWLYRYYNEIVIITIDIITEIVIGCAIATVTITVIVVVLLCY